MKKEIIKIKGDLISLAKAGEFDVIAHGCNCFCTMGAGLAPQMAKEFGCDKFPMESEDQIGNINKLGCIDYKKFKRPHPQGLRLAHPLYVVNCYSQYGFGLNHKKGTAHPLEYEALAMCFRKMNYEFKGMHIGLPWIGCGLAGGSREKVAELIEKIFTDCTVTIVNYNGTA